METIYPLSIVVSNDQIFSKLYNESVQSALFVSGCMSEEGVADLFRSGAAVDKLILINGDGENLVRAIGQVTNWDSEIMPQIGRILSDGDNERTIGKIYEEFNGDAIKCGMG